MSSSSNCAKSLFDNALIAAPEASSIRNASRGISIRLVAGRG
jgi:hypothetical protein